MTTHQRSPVKRFWLGSVADELARSSACPVLFLRAAEVVPEERIEDAFKHILVPLDGSALSEMALPVARDVARADNAQVTLFNMVRSSAATPMVSGGFVPGSAMDLIDPTAELQAGRDYVDSIAEAFDEADVRPRTEVVAATGSAASEILEFAREINVDLIVMTTRGEGGVRRLLLGSVADKVLRAAEVPVLLFSPEADA